MNVTKKELPKRQVALTIEVSVAEAQPWIEKTAKKVSEDVKIPGFRPGHVPYDVLKKHVGEAAIYQEAFQAIVEETYPKAVEQEKLPVLGRAKIDVEKLAPGNPIVYVATVSLFPDVKLAELKKIKARRVEVKVDQAELDKTMKELRQIRASEALVMRAAAKGDKVLVDFQLTVDGVQAEGGQASKMPLVIGEGRFIPGFEEQVTGMVKDQEKDFELIFPAEYFKKELAGKQGKFHVKLVEVYEVKLPELSDEFAKELQFKDLADLKVTIEKNISTELEKKESDRFEAALLSELAEKSKISDLPEDLIKDESDKMLHELRGEIEQRNGLKFEDYMVHIKKTEEELMESFKPRAAERLKVALVARVIAEEQKLAPTPAEVEAEMKKQAVQFAGVPEMMEQMSHPAYKRYVENTLAHRKVIEYVVAQIQGK